MRCPVKRYARWVMRWLVGGKICAVGDEMPGEKTCAVGNEMPGGWEDMHGRG